MSISAIPSQGVSQWMAAGQMEEPATVSETEQLTRNIPLIMLGSTAQSVTCWLRGEGMTGLDQTVCTERSWRSAPSSSNQPFIDA